MNHRPRFALLPFFFLLSATCLSQHATDSVAVRSLRRPDNKRGTVLVTYAASMGSAIEHELRIERFFQPKWSLMYTAGYSYQYPGTSLIYDTEGYRLPMGISLGAAMSVLSMGAILEGGNVKGAPGVLPMLYYSSLLPDAIAYHYYLSKNLDLSPYLNFSGLTIQHDYYGNVFYYAPKAGIRLMHYLGSGVVMGVEQSFRLVEHRNVSMSGGAYFTVRF